MVKLSAEDIDKNWPLLVGNPVNPDRVTVAGFETQSGKRLEGCRVILQAPDGELYRLEEGATFHLQIQIRYIGELIPPDSQEKHIV